MYRISALVCVCVERAAICLWYSFIFNRSIEFDPAYIQSFVSLFYQCEYYTKIHFISIKGGGVRAAYHVSVNKTAIYTNTHTIFFLLQIILSIWITFQWVGVKKMMIQIKRRSSRATKMERMRTRSNELCCKPNEHTNIFSSTKDYRIDRIHANILLCLKHNLWICT